MKIAIATVQVPFTTGGAEIHAAMLKQELEKRGHSVDIVTIPFKWYPATALIDCMVAGRMLDLTEVNGEIIDLVISLKFPAYFVKHSRKVVWLLHQHRQAYDLWETTYGDLHQWPEGTKLRDLIVSSDNKYLAESCHLYTNSQNTADRLLQYNGISAKALYHPPLHHEQYYCAEYGDYIFYPSRIDAIKRQRLLVEAAKYLQSEAKIILAGSGSQTELEYLQQLIVTHRLQDKVTLVGSISGEHKIELYAKSLAVYFGAYNEDFGYVTLEAFLAHKAVITHPDSGGPLEFVKAGENGYISEAEPQKLASVIDELYDNRTKARQLGEAGQRCLQQRDITWDHVITQLLAP